MPTPCLQGWVDYHRALDQESLCNVNLNSQAVHPAVLALQTHKPQVEEAGQKRKRNSGSAAGLLFVILFVVLFLGAAAAMAAQALARLVHLDLRYNPKVGKALDRPTLRRTLAHATLRRGGGSGRRTIF